MNRELLHEIKKVNRQAALYIARTLPLLVARKKFPSIIQDYFGSELPASKALPCVFEFDLTPQGLDYWVDICDQLPEGYGW